MSKVLLDTCVFSYVLKGDTRALAYRARLEHAQPCLYFMTVAELYRWSLARRWGAKRLAVLMKPGI
jgi:predicted nucleic acid-binding protein